MRFSDFHHGTSVLTVPGLGNSGATHWQTRWEAMRHDTSRVVLGMWNAPRRNVWVTKLDQAVRAARAPVVLVAHSLGCLTVAWWASLAGQPWGAPVAGALLVAPPDPMHPEVHAAAADFAPHPKVILPFPALVVASRNDPYATIQRTHDMAKDWGAGFVDVGALGHINAASGIGAWPEGLALLERLIEIGESDASSRALADAQQLYDESAERIGTRPWAVVDARGLSKR